MAKKIVLISNLSKFGNALAREVRKNLAWSSQLSKAVTLSKVKEEGNVISITVAVGENKKDKSKMPLSGMARAFELGSGIHSARGGKKYTIRPRLKKALWFYLDNPYPNAVLFEKGGQIGITTKKVEHPGVAARPYMAKSLQAIRGKAVAELTLDIKKNLIDFMNVTIREINQK